MSCLFEIDNVNFRFYSDDEFKRTAAAQITEEMSFDSLNAPVRGGLYDPRMGPLDQFSNCETCSLSERACPGHMGYIQLEYPAYHPRMKTDLRSVLHGSCIYCQRLKIKPQRSFFYKKRFELVRAGLFTVSRQLEESPDAFYGDLQEKHLEAIFGSESSKKQRKQTTTLSQKKKIADDDDSDDDENENEETEDTEKEVVDSVTGSSENRNPYMLTDAEMQEVDKVVQQLIVREAKKNGYGEDQLDAFFKSVVYDVHAPVHHERLLIIRELYAEISGPCPFCRSTKASWTSPDKSANKLFCVVPRKSRPPTLTNTSHLALQRIARAVYNQTTESDMESLYPLDLSRPIYMFPQEVYNFVAAVWKNDFDLFQFIYNSPGVDEMTYKHFFMSTVPVPPNRYRAPMKRAGAFFEHDLNYLFRQVIHHTKGIKREKALLPGDMLSDVIFSRVNDIQGIVNNLFDFDDDAQALHNRVIFGYKQVIEKKEGLMRTNMMGKRVNFSARSVILPDPMIHTNEVSVPIVFAKKLSFPEVVNDLNLTKLRQAILNGPDVYPGANALKVDGKVYNFKDMPLFRRKAMSQVLQKGNTVVMRHVRDGDMFLVNRQPSLHRVSMMAHKARVLSNQKTIRIHYANCKSYNADFDGDEMNLHIPQDLVSQSEARELVCNSSQYCSPTSGEPIRGLIQDHIVSGVLLTLKDTFLDREMYQSLVFGSLFHRVGDHRIETVPPCIMKPQPLWTGKQVITTILRDIAGNRAGINLDCGTKLKNCWGEHKEEETVTIRDNEVMTGIFDKNQIGASEFGIVHAFDEVYGHEASAELLTCFTRLTTLFLQYHGFTCGVDDLIVTNECNELRGKIMKSADSDARHATAEFAKQKRLPDSKSYDQNAIIKNMSALLINDRNRRKLDAEVKKALSKHTSKLISESIPRGLMKPFPANNMTLMTQSGAKGSLVNASQISCCLGLQEFEGRRVRPTVSGKTLPSFEVYDTSAISGGYVASRFLTGIKPQEYFFHCMAGRDGLIDTAVKTARSGYLQRCLIKALEDLTVKYDGTVRNEANTVVQFRYGGDSVDPLKSSFLHNSKFAAMNHKSIAERYCMSDDQFTEHTDPKIGLYKGSDPISSVFDPWRIKGSVSDKFATKLDQYIESNPDSLLLPEKKKKDTLVTDVHVPLNKFKSISNERFMRSLINPGEAVGVIAAQSIGEPSTQMTLNTFHFAGLDVAHVTVGIPRLIELFMVGKTKTVLTTLPVLPKHKEEMNVRKFAASISSVTFGDALQYVDITEKIGYNANTNERERSVALSIKFDLDEVSKYYGISIEQFWETVKAILIRNILLTIKQYLQHGRFKGKVTVAGVAKQKVIDVNQKTKQTSFENDEFRDAGEDHEESVMDDNDTPAQPMKKQQNKKKPKKKKDDEESDDDGGMDSESDDDEESDADEDDAEEESAHSKKKNKKVMTPKEDDKTLQVEDQSFFKAFDIQRTDGVLTLELNGKIKDSRIFLKDVIHKVCQTTYLRTYTGIEKVNVIQQKQGKFELQMEGFNMEELLLTRRAADFIDFDSIVTNDVGATADTYGIEAAYQLLVNEMKNVFKLYGIPVDERHISLIAEHMTNTGTYRACNRASMVSSPGLLHKATFESSLNFLGSGTAYAETEQVRGPSAELIFGKTVSQGTGSFDIVIPEVTSN